MRLDIAAGWRRICLKVCLSFGCVWLGGALTAATIEKIVVTSDTGASVSEQVVLANMDSAPGTTFDPKRLSDDIKRLYKTGAFEDVRTSLQEEPGDKVVITVTVRPKPVVREIIFEGNQLLKTKKLRDLVKHPVSAPVDEAQVVKDTEAIRKRYRDKGSFQTSVETIIQKVPNTNDANLVFRIQEEKRMKLESVSFDGNVLFSERKLRKTIVSKRHWWNVIFRLGGWYDENRLKMDEDALRDLYTENGYLDFNVLSIEKKVDKKEKWIALTFHLVEGAPYKVNSITFSGNNRFSEEELRPLVHLKPSDTYNSKTEREDLQRVRSKYEVLGYLDLRCYPDLTPNSEAHTVGIEFRINEGIPSRVHDVYISGNEVTKDHVIRRELALVPGDLGDAGKIRTSKSRLENLNYFETVEISAVSTEKAEEKDLQVRVKEKKTGQFSVGAGVSSEEAVLGFVELTQSNFDWKNWPSFRGGGQRLRLRTQLGTQISNVSLSFTEPWWLDRRLRLGLEAFYNTRIEDVYEQQNIGLGANVSRPWDLSWLKSHLASSLQPLAESWRQSTGLTVQQVTLRDFDDDVSAQMADEEGRYTANAVSVGVSRDTRNRLINPSRGASFNLGGELTADALGSYGNIVKFDAAGAKYFPVFEDSVLKLAVRAGVTDGISGDEPAIFDRYFAGGAYSVRGFRRRDISPVDENEDSLGGKALLTGTVEFIQPIFERISGSVFTDLGNVWEDPGDMDPTKMNQSVGLGLQIDLPIGPIRLDYGWPIATEMDHLSKTGRFHFNIGTTF